MQPGCPVSIVIPCYNAERFIDETLASVLAQDLADYEVIVVDDGSTDGSRALVEAHRGRFGDRLHLLSGPNQGASRARNNGTAQAIGRYIQYLDADDVLLPGAVAGRMAALERTGADVAYGDWRRWVEDEAGSFVAGAVIERRLEEVDADQETALFERFWSPPAAYLYRRSLVERIGGWNETLPIIQDARFALDAALVGGRFVHVPGVSALYRETRGASLSRRNDAAFVRDCLRNAMQVEEIWRARGALTQGRRQALARCYDYTARTLFFGEGDRILFDEAVERIRRLGLERRLGFVHVAARLQRLLGPDRARPIVASLQRARGRIGRPAAHRIA